MLWVPVRGGGDTQRESSIPVDASIEDESILGDRRSDNAKSHSSSIGTTIAFVLVH